MNVRQLLPMLMTLVLVACGGTPSPPATPPETPPSTPPVGGEEPGEPSSVVIPDTTKVLSAAQRASLTAYDSASGTLRFSSNAPAPEFRQGDVLVSEPSAAAPYGFLRKVTAVRRDGADTVFETVQANLTDAVHRGELVASATLTPDDVERTEAASGVTLASSAPTSPTTRSLLRPQVGVGDKFAFRENFDVTFVPVNGANGRGTVRISGHVEFNYGYGINVGIEACWDIPPVCVTDFRASVGFSQSSRLKITGDFDGTLGQNLRVAKKYFKPKVFFMGPVPVVVVPSAELFVTAGGEVKANMTFEAGEAVAAELGARWTEDDGWKDLSNFTLQGDVAPPSVSGSLQARAGLRSAASFLIYDVAGPEAALEGGVSLDGQLGRTPLWIVNGYLKGTVGFRVKLPVIGTLANYQATLFDIGREFARAANARPVLALTNAPRVAHQGVPVDLNFGCDNFGTFFYTARDAEDGCGLDVTVSSSRDGNLPLRHTFSSPGPRILTVTVRDRQGEPATISFVLDIFNPPPALTVRSEGEPRQGVPFALAASVTDANDPAGDLCRFTTWTVKAPDTVSPATGCSVNVTFGALGPRTVTVETRDRDGASAAQTVTLTVLPPPVNPFPRIVNARLYQQGVPCAETPVPNGATIELELKPCTGPDPSRYFARVELENPANEALTYEWKLLVVRPQDGREEVLNQGDRPRFPLYRVGNVSRTVAPCRLTLRVNAPDPARSKSLLVWSGRCDYNADILR